MAQRFIFLAALFVALVLIGQSSLRVSAEDLQHSNSVSKGRGARAGGRHLLAGCTPCPTNQVVSLDGSCPCVSPTVVQIKFPNIADSSAFLGDKQSVLQNNFAATAGLQPGQVRIAGQSYSPLTVTIQLLPLPSQGTQLDSATQNSIQNKLTGSQFVFPSDWGQYQFVSFTAAGSTAPTLPPSPPPPPGQTPSPTTPGFVPSPQGQQNSPSPSILTPPSSSNGSGSGLSTGAIAAIAVTIPLVVIALAVGLGVWYFRRHKGKDGFSFNPRAELRKAVRRGAVPASALTAPPLKLAPESGDPPRSKNAAAPAPAAPAAQTTQQGPGLASNVDEFSYNELQVATNNFSGGNLLGEGGFGRVYKGTLDDGTAIAIKKLSKIDSQGPQEFRVIVEKLSRMEHPNLVLFLGFCFEKNSKFLCYELMTNGNLEQRLHGAPEKKKDLVWTKRLTIALDAARGLQYMHGTCFPPVIHRDFKSSNVLLSRDFTAKVSDYGQALIQPEGQNLQTSMQMTFGYVAPEYVMTGQLTEKSDVYSFGVILLELLTGRKPVDMTLPPGKQSLVTWASPQLSDRRSIHAMVDPAVSGQYTDRVVCQLAAIAAMCVQPEAEFRPLMADVVQTLEQLCAEAKAAKPEDMYVPEATSAATSTSSALRRPSPSPRASWASANPRQSETPPRRASSPTPRLFGVSPRASLSRTVSVTSDTSLDTPKAPPPPPPMSRRSRQ